MKTQRPINKHRRKHPLLRNFALILSVAFLASGSQLSAQEYYWKGTSKNDMIDFSVIQTSNQWGKAYNKFEVLAKEGNDLVRGGPCNDRLFGDDGDDVLDGNGGLNDILHGGKGNDELRCAWGKDQLYGEDGNDTLKGGYGNDKLDGGNGNDVLYGEDEDDELNGGSGNDMLYGGDGNDKLDGEGGNDILMGGEGSDYLNGGPGNDILIAWGADENNADDMDTLDGGPGMDKFVIIPAGKVPATIIANFEPKNDTIDLTAFSTSSGPKEVVQLAGLGTIHIGNKSKVKNKIEPIKTIYLQPARRLTSNDFILPEGWTFRVEKK